MVLRSVYFETILVKHFLFEGFAARIAGSNAETQVERRTHKPFACLAIQITDRVHIENLADNNLKSTRLVFCSSGAHLDSSASVVRLRLHVGVQRLGIASPLRRREAPDAISVHAAAVEAPEAGELLLRRPVLLTADDEAHGL